MECDTMTDEWRGWTVWGVRYEWDQDAIREGIDSMMNRWYAGITIDKMRRWWSGNEVKWGEIENDRWTNGINNLMILLDDSMKW